VLAVTLVPALVLSVLEIGLRVTGTGHPTGLWTWQAVGGRRCAVDNPFFTWRWFDPRRAREAVSFAIEMPKPDGRIRIFVLGASAAQGDPDPAYSMSRFMEILFANDWPEADIEVVNLAMTAINSHVVLPIATSSFELDPDLVVVYLGNNEVIGPHGVVDGPRTAADRLRHLLVATRIGQLLQRARFERDVRQGDADEWGGMEDYLGHRVAHDDPRLERIYSDFERNLTDLVTAADRSGVPVVLATVAVNLADSPPFGSRHRPDLTDSELEQWRGLVDAASRLFAAGHLAGALEQLNSAVALDDQHAETAFLRGRTLMGLGRHREARLSFAMARDLDTLRFRADSRINGILRAIADRSAPAEVLLADVERAVDAASPGGAAGGAHLYEHVHLTPSGNYLAARTVVSAVTDGGLLSALSSSPPGRLPSEAEAATALGFTGWNLLQAGGEILARLRRPPFTETIGAEERARTLSEHLERLRLFLESEGLDQARRAVEAALRDRPDDWFLHYHLGRMLSGSDPDAAISHLRQALELRPSFDIGRRALGQLLLGTDQPDAAASELAVVAARHPYSPGAVLDLGIALLRARRIDQAETALRRAMVLDPNEPEAPYHLALALLAAEAEPDGPSREEAEALLERALAADPDHQDASRVLSRIREKD
jgi:tetratricopeptide (TPR) repeat protein